MEVIMKKQIRYFSLTILIISRCGIFHDESEGMARKRSPNLYTNVHYYIQFFILFFNFNISKNEKTKFNLLFAFNNDDNLRSTNL